MKLTNIRYNNNFIISDGKKFYLSEVNKDKYEDYLKNKKSFKMEKYKGDDITKELKGLMKEYDSYSHVHFYGFNIQKAGGWGLKSNHQIGGGWGLKSNHQIGGGWGFKK